MTSGAISFATRCYVRFSVWIYSFLIITILIFFLFQLMVPEINPRENEFRVLCLQGEDPDSDVSYIHSLDADDWEPALSSQLNFGYSNRAVWLKLSSVLFTHPSSIVELGFPQLDYVDLYIIGSQNGDIIEHQRSGDRLELSDKFLPTYRVLFRVNQPIQEFDVYIRILTDGSNQAPLSIIGLDDYLVKVEPIGSVIHFFLGFVVFACLFYGRCLFYSNDAVYLYCIILSLSITCLLLFHYRVVNIYSSLFSILAQHYAILMSIVGAFYSGVRLVQNRLRVWEFDAFDASFNAIANSTLFVPFLFLILPYQQSLLCAFIYLGFSGAYVACLVASFLNQSRGSKYFKPALIISFGWAIFVVSAAGQIVSELGWLKEIQFFNHSFLFGGVAIVLLMGLILSGSIQLEYEKKIRAEKALLVANERIYQADKLAAITTMSSGLIHEIKNPLNWSKGALVIALNENTDSSQEELLKDSLQGLERIEEIVSGLNWFAKAGPVELIPLNLKSLIDKTVSLAKSQINGVIIDNKVGEGVFLKASETHLAQVIINLLSNSIKAIAPVSKSRVGKIQINAVECTQSSTGLKQLKVSWKDNGVGMSTDQLNKLFDPFYTTSDMNQGIGLGMSVVKQIIEKHHGRIEASSDHYSWSEIHLFFNLT